jgi:chromosomal replication initiator protein
MSAPPRVVRAVRAIAQHYGLTADDIVGRKQPRALAIPRREAMWVARAATGLSLPQIGAAFGGRHHTSILEGCRAVDAERRRDAPLTARLDRLVDELRAMPAAGGAP